MKACILFLILLASAVKAGEEPKKLYHGDEILRLVPATKEQLRWLRELRLNNDSSVYDFWSEPRALGIPVDIHVSKKALHQFHVQLEAANIEYTVNVHDLQKLIDKADAIDHKLKPTGGRIVGTFARYNDIVSWLRNICRSYPKLAKCGSVGKSFQSRDIPYITLSAPSSAAKKIIVVEGGIHAREWLGIATVVYLIDRMVTTYSTDSTAKRMLGAHDFIFIPVVNTDGYEYSRTNRMWRKTRSKRAGKNCFGVDPNRNYDMSWGGEGSSSYPCSEIYCGPSAFSEPETRAMSAFLSARKSQILAYFTIHTYSQFWLVPYGDKEGNYPPDYQELLRVAKIGAQALMATNNQTWFADNTVDLLGAAAGGSDDWAKAIGIKYSYTLELRPNSGGASNGFIVPTSEIDPSGREVWAGITAAVDAMKK